MGGRRLGRSEPAFRVASTTTLPPPTCTARRDAGQNLWLLFCCEACMGRIVCGCASRPVSVGSSAGCVSLQRPCFAGFVCLPFHLCHAMPTAVLIVCPHSFCFAPLVHYHVRQDRRGSCKDCPVGSYNTGLQWRPVRRFLTFCLFPAESIDPGPWFSVKFIS